MATKGFRQKLRPLHMATKDFIQKLRPLHMATKDSLEKHLKSSHAYKKIHSQGPLSLLFKAIIKERRGISSSRSYFSHFFLLHFL